MANSSNPETLRKIAERQRMAKGLTVRFLNQPTVSLTGGDILRAALLFNTVISPKANLRLHLLDEERQIVLTAPHKPNTPITTNDLAKMVNRGIAQIEKI